MNGDKILVGVIMGSASDKETMKGCAEILTELGIGHEVKIMSAHRTPDLTRQYAVTAEERGIEVLIAGAGWAAHLAGVIAAHTTLPVIGVPIDSSAFQGLDSLLSTVQMPPGIPVATVSVGSGGARNAAILAAEILALKHPEIHRSVKEFRRNLTEKAARSSAES